VNKIPVTLDELPDDSPREDEKNDVDDKKSDNDDLFSYQEKQEDDQAYNDQDDDAMSDIRRTSDDDYLDWTEDQCKNELKTDKNSIKAYFRLGMIYLEQDEYAKSRAIFKDK
jgi:hypothetical protein